MEPVRLFILHRYQLLIEVLRLTLRRHHTVHLVGHTHELQRALECLPRLAIDILLLDAGFAKGEEGPKIRQLQAVSPGLKILPLGLDSHREILTCLEAGAIGHVSSATSLTDLIEILCAVHGGRFESRVQLSPLAVHLTPREREIFELLAEGRRNKEIARELRIALPTVKVHIHKILKKTGARNRHEVVRLVLPDLSGRESSRSAPEKERAQK